jgi:hypothetical protein
MLLVQSDLDQTNAPPDALQPIFRGYSIRLNFKEVVQFWRHEPIA